MNEKPTEKVEKLPIITKFCITIGELPTSYLMSMSYLEQVTWLCNFLEKTMIPALNQNAKAVDELQSLFELLRTYVNDYFDNLDVQEEINNKLNEMAESGQLTDIIAQYLGLAGMIAFDTVSDMKQATNLVNGSKCYTLGYYSVNDGGESIYKIRTITNEDTIDEKKIIALHNNLLIAELIEQNKINSNSYGLYGNGINDDSINLQYLLNSNQNKNVELDTNSSYKTSSTLNVKNTINGNKSKINSSVGAITIDNDAKDSIISNLEIESEYFGINIGDQSLQQTSSPLPNRNIVFGNKIVSEHGNRLRVGIGGNTHGKNVFMLNNIKTTGSDVDDLGIESWNGDSIIGFNSIIKTGEEERTGASGITFGHYDGQKALFNIIEGYRYGIEVGNVGKNTLILGNTIRNCKYPIGLTTNGYEKDTFIAYNYIELSDNDDIAIDTGGNEDIHISHTIIEWTGDGIGGRGLNMINHSKRLFIDNCIFKNIDNPMNIGSQVDEVYISNCSFINCSNRLISTQAKIVIIDKCYFENCGILYQYSNNSYYQKWVLQNSTFFRSENSNTPEYVLSGKGLSTIGIMESNNNRFINCYGNPMRPNTDTDGDKRPLLYKENGLYYSYNNGTFSDLLTLITETGAELQPGDKIYDNYLMVEYIIKNPYTRYGQDFLHDEINRSSQPNSGSFKKGDKIFNNYSSNTSVQGWVCTTAGTFETETEPVFITF